MQEEDIYIHLESSIHRRIFDSILDCYDDKQNAFNDLFEYGDNFSETNFTKFYNSFRPYKLIITSNMFKNALKFSYINETLVEMFITDGYDVYSEMNYNKRINPLYIIISKQNLSLLKLLHTRYKIPIRKQDIMTAIQISNPEIVHYLIRHVDFESYILEYYLCMYLLNNKKFYEKYEECLRLIILSIDYQIIKDCRCNLYQTFVQNYINSFDSDSDVVEYDVLKNILEIITPITNPDNIMLKDQDEQNVLDILKKHNLNRALSYLESLV